MLSFEGVIISKMDDAFLDIGLSFKAPGGRNFNRLFNFSRINVCEGFANPPIFGRDWVQACRKKFPQLCNDCPYLPGPLNINYTETMSEESCPRNTHKNMPNLKSGTWFPDGEYKSTIKVYSKKDKEIFYVAYYFRIKTGDTKAF
ncbi:hypothetical protein ACKWTF_009489 [Chironomus riparius]